MAATMKDMELILADTLLPEQLMEDDLIKVDGDLVKVISVDSDSTGDNYFVKIENDFGEEEVIEFHYQTLINLYCFVQE